MLEGMYKVTNHMITETRRQEHFSENMANSSVAGYRGKSLDTNSFSGILDQNLSRFEATGYSVSSEKVVHNFTQGPIRLTARSLDFAISGDGFFAVQGKSGNELYTRNGAFFMSPDGELLTSEGLKVMTEGKLKINDGDPVGQLHVKQDGSLIIPTAEGEEKIGQLKIVEIAEPQKLERASSNYFYLSEANKALATEPENSKVRNFSSETANVTAIEEMANMIASLRSYEVSAKVLKMNDDLISKHLRLGE